MYFLGVDIGGFKSHGLIADAAGNAVGFGNAGAANPHSKGYPNLAVVVQDVMQQCLQGAGLGTEALGGIGLGIGGYDWDSELPLILEALEPLGLNVPIGVVNDAELGIFAAAREGWGVAVVSGSGSNARGWDKGRVHTGRVTGYGVWMGEGAGASETLERIRAAVAAAWARRGPETRLTQALMERVGARDETDLVQGLATKSYTLDHDAARVVFGAAEAGDAVANEIVAWIGRTLGSLAVGVIRQVGMEDDAFDVVLIGSFYKGSPRIIETMCETINAVAPRAEPVWLDAPPVVGAVLLGMESAGVEWLGVRERLIASTCKLIGWGDYE